MKKNKAIEMSNSSCRFDKKERKYIVVHFFAIFHHKLKTIFGDFEPIAGHVVTLSKIHICALRRAEVRIWRTIRDVIVALRIAVRMRTCRMFCNEFCEIWENFIDFWTNFDNFFCNPSPRLAAPNSQGAHRTQACPPDWIQKTKFQIQNENGFWCLQNN